MMKKTIKGLLYLILVGLFTLTISLSCSSVFSATISGIIKAELRNNSSSDELINLEGANVYIFFEEDEYDTYKSKWENSIKSKKRSLDSIIEMPTLSNSIRVTTTNPNGNFSLKTMWITKSPLFGKDGDEKSFYLAVYHKDLGMFFEDTSYSLFSDSSQNISFICKYLDKLKTQYHISLNTLDYSNNNQIDLNIVNPKVVIKYNLVSDDNSISEINEITQIYEEIPTTNNGAIDYSFISDKYYYDEDTNKYNNTRVYPKGYIYFYDKGAEGEKNFRMCNEEGEDLSTLGTYFEITENSNNLEKDIYVDQLNREYRINFNLQYPLDNENNDYSGSAPTLNELSPTTDLKIYFDGYNSNTNTIETPNNTIEANEYYKTITFNQDQIPPDDYYSFTLNRFFDNQENEIYPSLTYYLEDDENDLEYIQTNEDGIIIDSDNLLENTLISYSKDNYSTSVDTYLDRVKLDYIINFNLEDFEDGSQILINDEQDVNNQSFSPTIKFFILPYDGNYSSISTIDFTTAISENPTSQIDNNTYSFSWDKYDETNTIQYPILKYFIYDSSSPLLAQVSSSDNIEFYNIKDKASVIDYVEPIAFKKGVLEEDVTIDMQKLIKEYQINFTLKDIEDNNNEIAFTSFNPKVKLNIYKTNIDTNNLIDSIYIKESNNTGEYTFDWNKYGKNIDLEDLPTKVNQNEIFPIVQYYLFNTDVSSYQMLLDKNTSNPTVVTNIDSGANTGLYSNEVTQKNEDVYIRSKKLNFNIIFSLFNIATSQEITIREINPIITLYYNNGNEDIIDVYNTIPNNEIYEIEVIRDDNPISLDMKIDLEDKRDDIRYRLSNNDPTNIDPNLRYTVKDDMGNRFKANFTLTKANDNNLKLYVKDYKYLNTIDLEGRFIQNDDASDNDYEVWLIVENNNEYNEEDAIKLNLPTHANYKNTSETYNPSNIENGYFSISYNQNKIANLNDYLDSSKYLYQNFKLIVNSIRRESSPQIDNLDYMNIETIKNTSNNSKYIYVDTSTTYSP